MNTEYTFNDVLIKPKYSEVLSRKDVDLSCRLGNHSFTFPVISANMKTITEASMAKTMSDYGGLGILHRFNNIENNVQLYRNSLMTEYALPINAGVSIGVQDNDKKRFEKLYNEDARIFCIDVAHGHHVLVKNMLKWINDELFLWSRNERSKVTIIAGNIATDDAYYDLANWGADTVKVGVGPGCFVPKTKVTTIKGPKNIEDIKPGEFVLTHTGEYEAVTTTFQYNKQHDTICINDKFECTNKHEIYVIHKNDIQHITEDNLHEFAKWIPADELTEDFYMIELEK